MVPVQLDTRFNSFVAHKGKQCRVAQDLITGRQYVKVAEVLPTEGHDAEQKAGAILAQEPVHFASDVSDFTGYYVEYEPAEQSA